MHRTQHIKGRRRNSIQRMCQQLQLALLFYIHYSSARPSQACPSTTSKFNASRISTKSQSETRCSLYEHDLLPDCLYWNNLFASHALSQPWTTLNLGGHRRRYVNARHGTTKTILGNGLDESARTLQSLFQVCRMKQFCGLKSPKSFCETTGVVTPNHKPT